MTPAEPKTVLIVDDEPAIRMIARAALATAGFRATEAADAAAAEAAVSATPRPFDLILLDLTLPDEYGADLIPRFRARTPGTRILVVSGAHADDAAEMQADGFLNKPFNRAGLLAAVHALLGTG